MNHRLLSALAAGTLLAGSAVAFAQAPSASVTPTPSGHPFFDRMDSNRDGVVTRAEVTAVLEKRFAAIDTDRNGTISPAERQAQRDRKWDERFAGMDTDKNGQLSPAEFRAAKIRPGKDGAGAPPPSGPGSEHGFGRGQGKRHGMMGHGSWGKGPGEGRNAEPVTKDAFMKSALTRFDLLDSNDDGKITTAERDAARGGMRGPMGHGHRGPMPKD